MLLKRIPMPSSLCRMQKSVRGGTMWRLLLVICENGNLQCLQTLSFQSCLDHLVIMSYRQSVSMEPSNIWRRMESRFLKITFPFCSPFQPTRSLTRFAIWEVAPTTPLTRKDSKQAMSSSWLGTEPWASLQSSSSLFIQTIRIPSTTVGKERVAGLWRRLECCMDLEDTLIPSCTRMFT